MARVTVEDCILNVPNRFDLVIVAGQRAKQISSGHPLTVDRDNDKDAVVALREIADMTVDLGQLEEEAIQHFCRKQQFAGIERQAGAYLQVDKRRAMDDEIDAVFDDARQHVDVAAADKQMAGLSFSEENLDVED